MGQIKIQGVATCMYLCMDSCGLPYSSKEFTDECVFNEILEQHHYNTYTSAKHSGARRTMYLALDARGKPRKVMLPAKRPLGKLSGYVRVLTRPPHRALLNTCSNNPTAEIKHAPRHVCRNNGNNNKKKKAKCKEGEKGCEPHPKRPKKQQQKCEGGSCSKEQPVTVKNPINNGTATGLTRHKRPFRNKKQQQQKPTQQGQGEVVRKKLLKQLKKRRKVGRALNENPMTTTVTEGNLPLTTPWFVDEESWTSTSEEMIGSSTQVEDVTLWDMTTTSGIEKEFFRSASVVLETAEDLDS